MTYGKYKVVCVHYGALCESGIAIYTNDEFKECQAFLCRLIELYRNLGHTIKQCECCYFVGVNEDDLGRIKLFITEI